MAGGQVEVAGSSSLLQLLPAGEDSSQGCTHPTYSTICRQNILLHTRCCCQAVMKIITYGFIFTGKYAYMRRSWNVLDLFVVLVGVMVLALVRESDDLP